MNVLVIDGNRNGLAVARAVRGGVVGVKVHLAAPSRRQPARFSRSVSGFWEVPTPDAPDRWAAAMYDLGARLTDRDGPPVLIPVNDIYVLLGARYWDLLGRVFRAGFLTDVSALDRCLAKDRCYDLADELGVPVPTHGTGSEEYLGRGGTFPAIVKPAIRNAPEFASHRPFRARVCATVHELSAACNELLAVGARPIVQAFIAGGDDSLVTAGIAGLDGAVLGVFTGRKLRQFPPSVGEASYAESFDAPAAASAAIKMLSALRFTGLAQVEFKRHGGIDWLLEINPRSWSWIGLAPRSGVNLPAALVNALMGRSRSSHAMTYGCRWMYAGQDLRYHGARHGVVGLLRWAAQAASAQTHAHWRFDDPGPALALAWTVLTRRRLA